MLCAVWLFLTETRNDNRRKRKIMEAKGKERKGKTALKKNKKEEKKKLYVRKKCNTYEYVHRTEGHVYRSMRCTKRRSKFLRTSI